MTVTQAVKTSLVNAIVEKTGIGRNEAAKELFLAKQVARNTGLEVTNVLRISGMI